MTKQIKILSIGETAKRSGVSTSALRFYESKGLIKSSRTNGNQRFYKLSILRRIAVIKVAQNLGFTLAEITRDLTSLPDHRTPTKRDWEKLSRQWQGKLDERIGLLRRLQENLSGCIGCGCLSLKRCNLYNQNDVAACQGAGPRYLLGDSPVLKINNQ